MEANDIVYTDGLSSTWEIWSIECHADIAYHMKVDKKDYGRWHFGVVKH